MFNAPPFPALRDLSRHSCTLLVDAIFVDIGPVVATLFTPPPRGAESSPAETIAATAADFFDDLEIFLEPVHFKRVVRGGGVCI